MTPTQQRIFDTASRLFRDNGYTAVSLRHIARDAAVEPSLIIRHFGTKEQLFLQVLTSESENQVAAIPLNSLGRDMVGNILNDADNPNSVMHSIGILLQASDNQAVRQEIARTIDELVIIPVASRLQGANANLRASLIAAQIVGLLVQLYVVKNQHISDSSAQSLVNYYGNAIQGLVDN